MPVFVYCWSAISISMPIHITAEQKFIVGHPTTVEGAAPEGSFVAVFEDDQDTGYFYALDVLSRLKITTCDMSQQSHQIRSLRSPDAIDVAPLM
jgi:hypothetical protein